MFNDKNKTNTYADPKKEVKPFDPKKDGSKVADPKKDGNKADPKKNETINK